MNAGPVSTEVGAERDTLCLTTVNARVADTACAAVAVASATARQAVFDPASPALTEAENRPVEPVVAVATVTQLVPSRCNDTVRPDATGETTPDNTTDSAGAAHDGLTPNDTVEATAACADDTAASASDNTMASTARTTTARKTPGRAPGGRPVKARSRCARSRRGRSTRTPDLPTARPLTSQDPSRKKSCRTRSRARADR